ncbi:MAG TPA: glycosyltransferase [Nitrospira sp.]|nr:glycosyltransferase [Nitrospira sp.]
MIGPSPNSHGGIASVVSSWKNVGLFERWPITYLETQVEGSKIGKLRVGLSAFCRFLQLLTSKRVACVHIHVARRRSFWRKTIFALAAFASRCPVLLHLHSGGFARFYHRECNHLQKRVVRFVLDHAAQLVVLSKGWHEILRPISTNSNITVVANFLEPSVHAPIREERDKDTILFLGLLNKDKGFYDLLESMPVLCREFPRLVLVCGGKGEHGQITARIKQLQIEQYVKLAGWLSGDAKDRWLSRASIFVLPSYVENMPMGILEAMRSGMPIVSTKVGCIPDIIEHGREGLLVDHGDTAALQTAIRRLLLNDDERRIMGRAARRRIDLELAPQVVVPILDTLYSKYLARSGQQAGMPHPHDEEVRCV